MKKGKKIEEENSLRIEINLSLTSPSATPFQKREEKRSANPFRGKISIGPRAASSLMYENGKKSK
jgi:hypothetical protein